MAFFIERSALMASIKGKQNKATELRLIEIMRNVGITGWRRQLPIFGRPDFIFTKDRVAVFVDGCFWHGCPVCYKAPAANQEFWKQKLSRNKARDKTVTSQLRREGWRVIRIWEHELKYPRRVVYRLRLVLGKPKPENKLLSGQSRAGNNRGKIGRNQGRPPHSF